MESSAIQAATYDQAAQALDVTFATGRRYRYFEVPAEVARGFAQAPSKGSFFNTMIRDRFVFEEHGRRRRTAP